MNNNYNGNDSYVESIQQKKDELIKLKKVLKKSREQCKEIEHLLKFKSINLQK